MVVPESSDKRTLMIGGKSYNIEVADTPEKQQLGLSGREEIGSDGMLFVFPRLGKYPFWMKDMKFDLDFIWIREGVVVEIMPNIPKPIYENSTDKELTIYPPSQDVDMMLEVTAGFAAKKGIKVGDLVNLNDK